MLFFSTHRITMSTSSTQQKPILIIGGGISSLALAQSLLNSRIPFHIYERDAALDTRLQGYRFRLNSTGINALATLLPSPLLVRLEKCCGIIGSTAPLPFHYLDAVTTDSIALPELIPTSSHGKKYAEDEFMNIDRGVMRSVLLSGLEPLISFSKSFLRYETTASGVVAHFADGMKVEGILLIGADGVKSRVRKQLIPDHKLVDTEVRVFFGKTLITPKLLEKMNEKAAKGGITIIQDSRKEGPPLSCLLEPVRFRDEARLEEDLPASYVYWVFGAMKPFFSVPDEKLLALRGENAASETIKLTNDWDKGFRCLFELQEVSETSIIRTLSARSELPVWDGMGRVTLVGDAAHPMSPTAGIGAVTALRSAAVLARVIKEEGISGESLRGYEDEMRVFAGNGIRGSLEWGKKLFGMKDVEDMVEVWE